MLKELLGLEKYEEIKQSDNLLYKSLEISTILFKNDLDKGGFDYMNHLLYVYENVYTIDEKVIALMHDVMEDKKITKEELLDIGFPLDIVNDIKVLTKEEKGNYNSYIDKIIKEGSKRALEVKLSDLKHNIDLTRIKNPSINDYERVEKKYIPAYEKILNKLKEYE